jgi:hypothetical protein
VVQEFKQLNSLRESLDKRDHHMIALARIARVTGQVIYRIVPH